MKTLLVAINAKYIHSNLAVRSLKAYTEKQTPYSVDIAEFTINQTSDFILTEIYKESPDIIGFSCYIWNWTMVQDILPNLKKILPQAQIILGGPEVSYDTDEAIRQLNADFIISGAGEQPFADLVSAMHSENADFSVIPSLIFAEENKIFQTEKASPLPLERIPFVYQDMEGLDNRIIYYESSRGCPYRCSYCLSSIDNALSFLPLERVFKDLQYFLDMRVRQVKFVDRTFNCNKKHAYSILQFLIEQDNSVTNFHFEITADTLDSQTIQLVQTARTGLFQFEIGIQSTNPDTLKAISRECDFSRLSQTVRKLQEYKNIHLHLDLIAGLPHENYASFRQSFNDVHSLSPDQLQLGFLKVLKGSFMHRQHKEYGIVYRQKAPYEVLYTDALPFDDVLRLKMIEEIVEKYYNSCRYKSSLSFLYPFFDTPFDLFASLAAFYETNGYYRQLHSKEQVHTILFEFFLFLKKGSASSFKWRIKYDMYSHEKVKRMPSWMDVDFFHQYREIIYDFYNDPENRKTYFHQYKDCDPKQIQRITHLEIFPFHPLTGEERKCALLFDYKEKDILGNANVTEVLLAL